MLTPIILMVVGIPGFFYSSNTQIPEDTIKIHAMRFPDFHLRQAVPEIFRPMLDCSPLKNGTRFYWYLGRNGWANHPRMLMKTWHGGLWSWELLYHEDVFLVHKKGRSLTEPICKLQIPKTSINQGFFFGESKLLFTAPCIIGFLCVSVC